MPFVVNVVTSTVNVAQVGAVSSLQSPGESVGRKKLVGGFLLPV